MSVKKIWHRLLLVERPSISLSLFRPFLALAVGTHLIPTFFQMQDNYLSTAFKVKNETFFPRWILSLVDQSPDWFVTATSLFFYLALILFAFGLFTQISCITMTIGCYYFYALNSLHIGTLSYDILFVTLILMCATPYPGDSFSLDAIRRGDRFAYRKRRPFFIQRLIQIQLATTYFFTGLVKITGRGNWIHDNPLYYLLNTYPDGIVKNFPFRSFFAQAPSLCYGIALLIVLMELTLPFLLFIRTTRPYAILCGIIFHTLILTTLHVPSLFFFLCIPLFCLFIDPETILKKVGSKERKACRASIQL